MGDVALRKGEGKWGIYFRAGGKLLGQLTCFAIASRLGASRLGIVAASSLCGSFGEYIGEQTGELLTGQPARPLTGQSTARRGGQTPYPLGRQSPVPPSRQPSYAPQLQGSGQISFQPTIQTGGQPSGQPSIQPSIQPAGQQPGNTGGGGVADSQPYGVPSIAGGLFGGEY